MTVYEIMCICEKKPNCELVFGWAIMHTYYDVLKKLRLYEPFQATKISHDLFKRIKQNLSEKSQL